MFCQGRLSKGRVHDTITTGIVTLKADLNFVHILFLSCNFEQTSACVILYTLSYYKKYVTPWRSDQRHHTILNCNKIFRQKFPQFSVEKLTP